MTERKLDTTARTERAAHADLKAFALSLPLGVASEDIGEDHRVADISQRSLPDGNSQDGRRGDDISEDDSGHDISVELLKGAS
jgi:hypothetical protein